MPKKTPVVRITSAEADTVVNLSQWFNTIYVYKDAVDSYIVGDSRVPLLRTLPIRGNHGNTIYDRFTNIHYVLLLSISFGMTDIDILVDIGRRVSFKYCVVTLTTYSKPY